MPSSILNLHVIDPKNVGDLLSSPLQYFEFPGYECDRDDIRTVNTESLENKHIIIGGGGLIYKRFLPEIQAVNNYKKRGKLIFWGVGQQRYGTNPTKMALPFDYESYLAKSDLVGIRDADMIYPWVPCVSCMHPAFDRPRSPQHEIVVFSHKKFRLDIPGLPKMTNENIDFESVLDFLASGETILTSSFHGAYWGTLLGRKVVAFPFSSKFFTLRHPPILYPVARWSNTKWQFSLLGKTLCRLSYKEGCQICDTSQWRDYARQAQTYPDSLEVCRASNQKFYQKVIKILS